MSDLSILGSGDDGEPPRRRSRRRRRRVRGPLLSLLVIVVLALGAFYGGAQLRRHVTGDGIAAVRVVDGDQRDVVGDIDQDQGHRDLRRSAGGGL